jgi:hypothetical protein
MIKTLKYSAYIVAVAAMVQVGCGQKKECSKAAQKPINPNGDPSTGSGQDSELALLMRDMFEESDSLKQLVVDGQPLSGLKKFQDIHSAIPTDPDASGPVFEAFATSYIESIKKLEASDSTAIFNFNNMVDQCMNCHTEFCPGPKKRIKKLYIEE